MWCCYLSQKLILKRFLFVPRNPDLLPNIRWFYFPSILWLTFLFLLSHTHTQSRALVSSLPIALYFTRLPPHGANFLSVWLMEPWAEWKQRSLPRSEAGGRLAPPLRCTQTHKRRGAQVFPLARSDPEGTPWWGWHQWDSAAQWPRRPPKVSSVRHTHTHRRKVV